jgi:predicted transcriptional regulator YdeE
VRNDEDKCYDCSYDIACENLNNQKIDVEFEIVRLNPCEYAVVTCEFDSETSMRDAHEKPDSIFWGEWLKENPYTSAIDDLVNWRGNGYASIEQYSPFDPDTEKFVFKVWFPILRKESERAI